MKHKKIVRSNRNLWTSNVHDGTENEELLEEHESLDSNNNKGDNSAEDYRGFCDQKKLHSALHCC